MLEAKETEISLTGNLKRVVEEAVEKICIKNKQQTVATGKLVSRSYAAVAGAPKNNVILSNGSIMEIPSATNFMVVPDESHADKYTSAKETKNVICKVLRPSDCGLRVHKVSLARNSAVRINADTPDLEKLSRHPGLKEAGLRIIKKAKLNIRMIVHGIPSSMSTEEIREEIFLQNLNKIDETKL